MVHAELSYLATVILGTALALLFVGGLIALVLAVFREALK